MANPIFGANSRLDLDTLTTTAAAALSPEANLFDDRIFTTYKNSVAASPVDIITDAGVGNTVDVDYFMAVGHDFLDPAVDGNGAVLATFADSADGISYPTPIFSVTPAVDTIIARSFPKVTNRFFRLRLTRAATFVVSIGQLQWGARVEIPTGAQVGFDPNQERIFAKFSRSQTGNILGAVTSFAERRASISIPLLESTFIDGIAIGDFRDFWDNHAALMLPFLFHWNPGNPGSFEVDSFFAIIDPDSPINRQLTTQLPTGFRTLELEVVGLKE